MAFYPPCHQPSYGPCDGFFFETTDDSWYEQKALERERNRHRAKERQHQLASELSRVTSDAYQGDVLQQMLRLEQVTLPDVNSIDIQTEIQWFMRPFLLDFLVEAHSAFALLPDTLYLAVNLLDRYCSRRVVYKRHYQLVGCAALLIASKYGDRKDRVPQIKELKAMCCALYEEEMFTQMEWHLLQTLDWTIGHPTIDAFLQITMSDTFYEAEVEHMSWYISELALFHKEFVSIPPSTMAKSALALSRCILGRPQIDVDYEPSLVARLYTHLQLPSDVVSKKYASLQFSSASVSAQMFIAQEQAKQQTAPTTPAVESQSWNTGRYGTETVVNNPQTPQKMQYQGTTMSHGLYTPPITPENENAAGVYGKEPHTLTPKMPLTPTSASGMQYPSRAYEMDCTAGPQEVCYY